MRSLLNALQEGRLIELPENEKEKALQYLSHLIEAIPDLGAHPDLAEAMFAREQSQNTGIGMGVACPHVRAPGNGELLCAVGWSPNGIDYGARDGMKVHLVIMYFIPESQKNTYLKEVSALAGAIQKQGGVQAIANAKDLATVREELLNWVSAAIDASLPEAKARMIRLEARQAATEAVPLATGQAPLQIFPLLVLALADGKQFVLCQNAELAANLEKDLNLGDIVKQRGQFDRGGYRLVYRTETAYGGGRTLYDYLAFKAG